jgi:hypothetical protein
LLTAGFTVPVSRAKLDPFTAALVSTGSLALYGSGRKTSRLAGRRERKMQRF